MTLIAKPHTHDECGASFFSILYPELLFAQGTEEFLFAQGIEEFLFAQGIEEFLFAQGIEEFVESLVGRCALVEQRYKLTADDGTGGISLRTL